jgi:hypothetical protein
VTHRDRADEHIAATAVDATLEHALNGIELAIGAYLEDSGDAERDSLVAAIGVLDDLAAQSDAYENSLVNSPILGFSGKGSVLGETSGHPFVEMVPNSELAAQVDVVKAAKAEVVGRTLTTFEALRAAVTSLDELRRHQI